VLLADPALNPDYVLVLDEREDVLRLLACCECRTDVPGRSPSAGARPSAAALESGLREALGVRVAVRVLPPGTVPRTEVGKAVRVLRWREGSPPLPGLD